MLGLLCFPNFAQPFIASLALTNLAYLSVEILKPLSLCVRWDFDGSLLRNESHLIISILVCGAIEHRADPFADGHVVHAPIGIKQNAIAILGTAIRERDQQQSAVAAQDFVDPARNDDAADELKLRLFALNNSECMQLIVRQRFGRSRRLFPFS